MQVSLKFFSEKIEFVFSNSDIFSICNIVICPKTVPDIVLRLCLPVILNIKYNITWNNANTFQLNVAASWERCHRLLQYPPSSTSKIGVMVLQKVFQQCYWLQVVSTMWCVSLGSLSSLVSSFQKVCLNFIIYNRFAKHELKSFEESSCSVGSVVNLRSNGR